MRWVQVLAVVSMGVSMACLGACKGKDSGGTGTGGGGGAGPTGPTGPTGSGWGATQSNPSCSDPPGFTPGTVKAGDACENPGDCVPVCCPCPDGARSYWGNGCKNGICAEDGSCGDTVGNGCP